MSGNQLKHSRPAFSLTTHIDAEPLGKASTTSTTEMDRWKVWKDEAQGQARKRSRVLEIELWDASAIVRDQWVFRSIVTAHSGLS